LKFTLTATSDRVQFTRKHVTKKKKDGLREIWTHVLHLLLLFPACRVTYLVIVCYCVHSQLILEHQFSQLTVSGSERPGVDVIDCSDIQVCWFVRCDVSR